MVPQFVKHFFQKISKYFSAHSAVNFLLSQEGDGQPVGQAHNGSPPGAEAPVHAVVVGTVRRRYGDGAVFDGDSIAAAVGRFHSELLIDGQVHGGEDRAPAGDLRPDAVSCQQHRHTGQAADQQDSRKQGDPESVFHGVKHPFPPPPESGLI